MGEALRIAFIGAGRIADLHAMAYIGNTDARIFGVCDTDAEWAARRVEEWGAERTYVDYREALADPEVDGAEILTPHHLHEEMAVAALAAGKHVSLQKPMARTLAEADAIVRAAADSDRVFRVLENYRYYPPYVRAKEMLDSGEIGEPVTLRMKVIGGNPQGGWRVPAKSWAWRFDEGLSGGGSSMFDHGYHMFSIAMWLFGPVEEVFAWIERTEVAANLTMDSPAVLMWRHKTPARMENLAHGVQARRLGSWETVNSATMQVRSKYYSNDEWVEITGTNGIIWINRCTGDMLQRPALEVYRDGETRAIHNIDSDWATSFVAGIRDWHRCIREGGQPQLSAEEGREVLRFSLAAHQSARERRPVRLEDLG
jgi:predicted dehydrogenase